METAVCGMFISESSARGRLKIVIVRLVGAGILMNQSRIKKRAIFLV